MTKANNNKTFHPPLTLADDAPKYVSRVTKLITTKNAGVKKGGAPVFAIPGNDAATLKSISAQATALAPKAATVQDLKAQLAAAEQDYNNSAAPLWKSFSEARNFARTYGENHQLPDLESIVKDYIYHSGSGGKSQSSPPPALAAGKKAAQ